MNDSTKAVEVKSPEMLKLIDQGCGSRKTLHGLLVYGRPYLESEGTMPVLQRHARRCAPPLERQRMASKKFANRAINATA